ncbi:MAG TPA: glutamate racemase, partial [bacterium]|nr:glutamate racemase [bacterium]
IGVFDSGLGGLTIVREIRRALPKESIVYFGDMARLPYGTKSREQILAYSIQNTLFLIKRKVKAVVIACNSSSSAAYSFLKRHFNLPILDVIEPAAERASVETRSGRIGVIATRATVTSGAYEKALKKLNPHFKILAGACPLFVPLVEEGWFDGKITEDIAAAYLKPLLQKKVDTLILGCTHYPLLRESIQKVAGPRVRLVDSIKPTVQKLESLLDKKGLRCRSGRKGRLKIFVSDKPGNFIRLGEGFLGEKLKSVKVVRPK